MDKWIPHFENIAAELEVYTKTGPGRKAHVGGEATATVRDTDEDKLVEMLGKILQRIERLEADQQSLKHETIVSKCAFVYRH